MEGVEGARTFAAKVAEKGTSKKRPVTERKLKWISVPGKRKTRGWQNFDSG